MKIALPMSRRKKREKSRLSIVLWAVLITSILGAIDFFEPLEDFYRGGRNLIRMHPADPRVVVVGIDEKTERAYGAAPFGLEHDAKLIDRLFALGARRVFIDRWYMMHQGASGTIEFQAALERHRDRVFLDVSQAHDSSGRANDLLRSDPPFRSRAREALGAGHGTAFGLSAEFPYAETVDGFRVRSFASMMSGVDGPTDTYFRPDWAIDMRTVPTVSFVDAAEGRVRQNEIAGKDVIVGALVTHLGDLHHVVGQGWKPGVYFHVVAAQTLREGTPRELGWIPAYALALGFSIMLARIRSKRTASWTVAAASTIGVALPLVFDKLLITADFLPAYLLFAIVGYRTGTFRELAQARREHAGTLLPNLAALKEDPRVGASPLIAMRIRNFSAICASYREPVEHLLVTELTRRLSLSHTEVTFYQAEDVLYWFAPVLADDELDGHLHGLARLLESHFAIAGRKIDIQIAFGVDRDCDQPVSTRIGRALLAADRAAGRNQLWSIARPASEDDGGWELSLMSELDEALDSRHIWVAYQPQVTIADGTVSGVEALVRWQHPARGAISPEAFIVPAEAHNRIDRLTLYVLEQATRECKPLLSRNPGFRLGVNLSARLLENPAIPARVLDVLVASGFPPRNLTLELTETAHYESDETSARVIDSFRAMGIEIAIDDYGTGNATLEYLRALPCQEIKIDRKFIAGLAGGGADRAVVESTIALAHSLDRRVIAEGIEDRETLDALRALGCDQAQGYFLSRPLAVDALFLFLAESPSRRAA